MNELRTLLQIHSRYLVTPCFCCGQDHEQQFVTVLLLEGDKRLGTICPTCLVRGPCRTANWIRQYAARLHAETEEVYEQYPGLSLPQQGWIMPAEIRADYLLVFADRLTALGDAWNTTLERGHGGRKGLFSRAFHHANRRLHIPVSGRTLSALHRQGRRQRRQKLSQFSVFSFQNEDNL